MKYHKIKIYLKKIKTPVFKSCDNEKKDNVHYYYNNIIYIILFIITHTYK